MPHGVGTRRVPNQTGCPSLSGCAARRVFVTWLLWLWVVVPGRGSMDLCWSPRGACQAEGGPHRRGPHEYHRSVTVAGTAADRIPPRPGEADRRGGGSEPGGSPGHIFLAVTSIPVGNNPVGLAFTPSGDLYVTNSGSANVSVISTATDTVVGRPIPVGGTPVWLTVAPDGNAYVPNSRSNSVSVIDTATNTVVGAPIPVGDQPGRGGGQPRRQRLRHQLRREHGLGDRHRHQHRRRRPDPRRRPAGRGGGRPQRQRLRLPTGDRTPCR